MRRKEEGGRRNEEDEKEEGEQEEEGGRRKKRGREEGGGKRARPQRRFVRGPGTRPVAPVCRPVDPPWPDPRCATRAREGG